MTPATVQGLDRQKIRIRHRWCRKAFPFIKLHRGSRIKSSKISILFRLKKGKYLSRVSKRLAFWAWWSHFLDKKNVGRYDVNSDIFLETFQTYTFMCDRTEPQERNYMPIMMSKHVIFLFEKWAEPTDAFDMEVVMLRQWFHSKEKQTILRQWRKDESFQWWRYIQNHFQCLCSGMF